MLFRRSSNNTPQKNNAAQRQNQARPQQQHAGQQQRREPMLNARPPAFNPTAPLSTATRAPQQAGTPGNTAPQAMTPTPTLTPTAPLNPMSPIAMAQARRNQNNSASSFNRGNEQTRKLTVGRDISLNGAIDACDHVIIEGTVKATIKDGQVLEISESGSFTGIVEIERAEIAGHFEGELTVRTKLVLRPTAVVTGMIQYGSLQVDSGATLNGELSAIPQQDQQQQPGPVFSHAHPADNTAPQNNVTSSNIDANGFLKAFV